MRALLLSSFALLLLLALWTAPLAGDEDRSALAVRMFDVGVLVSPPPRFVPEAMGSVESTPSPLVGGEEPGWLPCGTIDELIEHLKNTVDPASWTETEGADVKAHGDWLVARHRPDVLDAVARALAALDAALHGTALVEVRAVPTAPPAPAPDVEALAAAPGSLSVVVAALDGRSSAAFSGEQRAFVRTYEARSGSTFDPEIAVLSLGLGAAVRPVLAGASDGSVSVEIDAHVARLDDLPTRETAAGPLAAPVVSEAQVRSVVRLAEGRWTRLDGPGPGGSRASWTFLARAVAVRPGPDLPSAEAARFAGPVPPTGAGPTQRSFDLADLGQATPIVWGEEVHLFASRIRDPGPLEVDEPMPVFPAEALVDLAKEITGPSLWDGDRGTLEARAGRIEARGEPAAVQAVDGVIRTVRGFARREVVLSTEVLAVPDALARATFAAAGAGHVLGEPALAALAAARTGGEAVRLEDLRARSRSGVRSRVTAGRRVAYLQDYDIEGNGSDAMLPVTRQVLDGVVLDVEPQITPSADAAIVTVRFVRSQVATPVAQAETPAGPLDLPVLSLLRLRTSVRIPFGATALVGLGSEGGRSTVLLLRPTLERAP